MKKLIILLKNIYIKINKKRNYLFIYSKKYQKNFLNKFEEPINNIERSYYQYCCQMKLNNKMIVFMMNLIALPLLFVYYFKKNSPKKQNIKKMIFISLDDSLKIIPNNLTQEFGEIFRIEKYGENFSSEDKKFFNKLIKNYPFSWYFLFKILINLRFYSYEILTYCPKVIVTCNERSFTSSLLTEYCHNRKILHINVMHGDKLFDITDSFFYFDRCYVWDKHYVNLFFELKAAKEQFIIARPDCLKIKKNKIQKIVDYTYYLGAETEEVMLNISKNLKKLEIKGNKIVVRPHPLYSEIDKIQKIFKDFEIEVNKKIDIETSVLRTKNVISLYSTVLYQAYLNNISIIIDDISNEKNFKKLKELDFICLNKEHKLFSEILKNKN